MTSPPDASVDRARRNLLRLGALGVGSAALAACGGPAAESATPSNPTSDTGSPPADSGAATADAFGDAAPDTTYPTPTCMETEDNILGPYYRESAPFREDLRAGVTGGVLFVLRGRVFGAGCTAPLADAIVDLWQADDGGHYDNDGSIMVDPALYRLRGRAKVTADGKYEFRTIIPGRYLNGSQYRPAHLHARVSGPGHRLLTTQLYFEGDPYNGVDPFIKKPLIMKVETLPSGEKLGKFDFVLART